MSVSYTHLDVYKRLLIDRVGCFTPKREELAELGPGEIGFITCLLYTSRCV